MHSIPEIQDGLEKAFEEVVIYIESQSDNLFDKAPSVDKWSTGEQLEHLIKSVTPINLGLVLPKKVLKWKYGTTERDELSYDQLKNLYQSKLTDGAKATTPYIPKPISSSRKEELLKKYRSEKKKLIKVLGKWDENNISVIVAPHPILGNLTIRELMFFTIYHNYHHLENIKSIN